MNLEQQIFTYAIGFSSIISIIGGFCVYKLQDASFFGFIGIFTFKLKSSCLEALNTKKQYIRSTSNMNIYKWRLE